MACGLPGSVCLAGHWLVSSDNGGASWALLLVTRQLLGGSILCALGLIGGYVGRIYEQVKGRPLYVFKECSLPVDVQEGRVEERARDAA